MHWSNSLYFLIPCLQILQLSDALAFGSLDKVGALNNVGQHFAARKKVGHHLLKRMDPGHHDVAPRNDEADRRNLLRRLFDPDQPSWAQLTLCTFLFLCAVASTVHSFRQITFPLSASLNNTMYGICGCVTAYATVSLGYIVWSCDRKFRSTSPAVGPAPVPIEAPDLENQLPQANGGQVPIHINDEAHHAGTAGTHIMRLNGVHAVAPQHEYEVQFPRGITSLGRDGPTFHPSWSYAQDIRSDESNSRDGRHSQGSSPSSNSHNSISPGRAGPSQPHG
ncbi:hypothetical protein SeMB42_g06502 [Synchytrium endobioticum]|uniref:Uncharacterized protein n=1 Tax=Synchytrium endobioticum TaxID=286115 RepID=A0A507CHU3_9FUNG|nr:hypothetical protein SeLEV6574_g07920 [Synchytrium endobioticum]TPX39048.1 hypothetical protein SeMB42_g06502 [Synchytrium endobioticum]